MNNVNSAALFRSLIVYAVCVRVAIFICYMLTNRLDYQSIGFVGVLIAVLVFPLLMKWHYPLLMFSLSAPLTMFFLPGRPFIFLPMVVVSLTISVVEGILNRDRQFIPVPSIKWSLFALGAVVIFTAEMTGGIGLRSMGSDVYGGKKYVILFIGILSFFAITAQPIPTRLANRYMGYYFFGWTLGVFAEMFPIIPSPLHFIYLVLPMSDRAMDEMGNYDLEVGVTRMSGMANAASGVFYWMLARYGIREILTSGKIWRPLVLGISFILMFLGGFRSIIIAALIVFALIFYLEKLHRTGLMMVVAMLGILGGALLVPVASHLPFTFQRSMAWLPLKLDPDARMDAESSTEWRLGMWQALWPEVPKYLLLGKGYAFSQQTFNEFMGRDATFKSTIDAAENPLALSSDFHSGPLSVIFSFGIWGVVAWLWFWAAGFRVVWRNYHYGDPALRHLNLFLFAFFVAKCFSFLFIFGGIVDDVGSFGCVVGLSAALNHGVRGPASARPKAPLTDGASGLPVSARPAFQR